MTTDATNSGSSCQDRVNNASQSRPKQPIYCTQYYINIYKNLLTAFKMVI